ncbi:MAG: hypothetical protein M0C28_02595 [Candidatus Moduliflexus flocculans]|nr:hypothetical protein [Candidatus Moduliflexus flocculans]
MKHPPQAGARDGRPVILLTNDDGFYRETIQVALPEARAPRPDLHRRPGPGEERLLPVHHAAAAAPRPARQAARLGRRGHAGRLHLLRPPGIPAAAPGPHRLGHEPGAEPRPAGHQLFRNGRGGPPGDLPRHPLDRRLAARGRQGALRPEVRGGDRRDGRRRRPGLGPARGDRPERQHPAAARQGRQDHPPGLEVLRPGHHREDRSAQRPLLLDRDGHAAPGGRRGHRRHGHARRLHHPDAPAHRHDRPSRPALRADAPDRQGAGPLDSPPVCSSRGRIPQLGALRSGTALIGFCSSGAGSTRQQWGASR